jgi:hypothetical protein
MKIVGGGAFRRGCSARTALAKSWCAREGVCASGLDIARSRIYDGELASISRQWCPVPREMVL